MDTMTFIAAMTKALAWPVAAVILGLIFRRPLGGLLTGVKLRRIKKGDFLADFEAGVQEIRAELPAEAQGSPLLSTTQISEESERLIDVAPVAAILQAWNEIEGRVEAAAVQAGLAHRVFPDALRALVEKGMIQHAVRDSIVGLRNMRNLAVHGPSERLTPRQAREFVTMAEAVMWSMEENLKRASTHS